MPAGLNTVPLLLLLVLIVYIVARRIWSGVKGRRYKKSRVLRIPVLYVLLTLFLVYSVSSHDYYAYYSLLLIPAGVIPGLRFGSTVKFFSKNSVLYYKRSQVIMIAWLISFLLRVLLEIFFPSSINAEILVDMILSFTTGLIIGETFHILREAKNHIPVAE